MLNNDDNYKLVGIMNKFGVYPDFVYPIFEKNGKYYFPRSENNIIISFREIKENIYLNKIRFLDASLYKNINDEYFVGDKQVVSFQINDDKFFISNIDDFVTFIRNFETDDYILGEEIDVFLDIINSRNNKIKMKVKNK